jgi:hypothetical protein
MSSRFVFRDSRPGQASEGKNLPGLLCAIEKLNQAARDGKVELVSISGKRRPYVATMPEIISYAVTGRSMTSTWETVSRVLVDVSHYVGTYSTDISGAGPDSTVTIEIRPRWGASLLHYVLRYTTGIYMPPDSVSGSQAARDSAEWLLVLVWRSVFNQALRRFHVPKEYLAKRTNDRVFKGRLDVQRQIRENSADQSKFCCVHSPLTVDTTINRTIRYLFRLLGRNPAYAVLLRDVAGYDERLAAFGVKECEVGLGDIDRIRFTRMSEGYRPLMQASKAVIRRFGASASGTLVGDTSFFIDLSELWENYLQAMLTAHLPASYKVVSPNDTGGEWLVAGERREIRPDLIVEQNGVPVAILDAKFKHYSTIGKFERDRVSRDDLYQMATYLYHYGRRDKPLLGLFISPGDGAGDLHLLENNRTHRIGVLNFDLDQWEGQLFDISAIKLYEEQFVRRFRALLESATCSV